MFNTVAFMLRELAELLLVAEAARVYLRQRGREPLALHLLPGMAVGVLLGAALVGWGALREWDPTVAALSTIALAMLVMLLTMGIFPSFQAIEARTESWLERFEPQDSLPLVVALFGALVACRETLEIGFVLHAMQHTTSHADLVAGTAVGAGAAALLAIAYRSIGARVGLLVVFRFSALLMSLLAIELLLDGIGGLLRIVAHPGSAWLDATQPFLEGGRWYGWVCAVLMIGPLLSVSRQWWAESARTA